MAPSTTTTDRARTHHRIGTNCQTAMPLRAGVENPGLGRYTPHIHRVGCWATSSDLPPLRHQLRVQHRQRTGGAPGLLVACLVWSAPFALLIGGGGESGRRY